MGCTLAHCKGSGGEIVMDNVSREAMERLPGRVHFKYLVRRESTKSSYDSTK